MICRSKEYDYPRNCSMPTYSQALVSVLEYAEQYADYLDVMRSAVMHTDWNELHAQDC